MKPIVRSKKFKKHYKQRIATNPKLTRHFDTRLRLFAVGKRGRSLNDHALKGDKLDLRVFSLGGDLRVVYQEADDVYILLDVGTHNQVY